MSSIPLHSWAWQVVMKIFTPMYQISMYVYTSVRRMHNTLMFGLLLCCWELMRVH